MLKLGLDVLYLAITLQIIVEIFLLPSSYDLNGMANLMLGCDYVGDSSNTLICAAYPNNSHICNSVWGCMSQYCNISLDYSGILFQTLTQEQCSVNNINEFLYGLSLSSNKFSFYLATLSIILYFIILLLKIITGYVVNNKKKTILNYIISSLMFITRKLISSSYLMIVINQIKNPENADFIYYSTLILRILIIIILFYFPLFDLFSKILSSIKTFLLARKSHEIRNNTTLLIKTLSLKREKEEYISQLNDKIKIARDELDDILTSIGINDNNESYRLIN